MTPKCSIVPRPVLPMNPVAWLSSTTTMASCFSARSQIPGRSAAGSLVTLSGHGKLHTIAYTGGNVDFDYFFFLGEAGIIHARWFVVKYLTRSATGSTGGAGYHLSQHCVHNLAHLAGTLALAAGLVRNSVRPHKPVYLDFFLGPVGNLLERQGEFYTEVTSPTASGPATA